IEEFLVDCLHSLQVQRPGVLDFLLADFSELRVYRGIVSRSGPAVKDTARTVFLFEFRILRVITVLWLLFGVEVVEIAEEFVEPVNSRQELIAIAQMVLTKLTADIPLRLKQLGDGRILGLEAKGGSGQTYFR